MSFLTDKAVNAIGLEEFQYHYDCGRMGAHLAMTAARVLMNGCSDAVRSYIEEFNLTEIRFIDPDLGQQHLDKLLSLASTRGEDEH